MTVHSPFLCPTFIWTEFFVLTCLPSFLVQEGNCGMLCLAGYAVVCPAVIQTFLVRARIRITLGLGARTSKFGKRAHQSTMCMLKSLASAGDS